VSSIAAPPPQPAPPDHPWRTMPHHGMTPHISGSSLSAQARYAAGTREILECFFANRPIREEYLIVHGGALAGTGRPLLHRALGVDVRVCGPLRPARPAPEPSTMPDQAIHQDRPPVRVLSSARTGEHSEQPRTRALASSQAQQALGGA